MCRVSTALSHSRRERWVHDRARAASDAPAHVLPVHGDAGSAQTANFSRSLSRRVHTYGLVRSGSGDKHVFHQRICSLCPFSDSNQP